MLYSGVQANLCMTLQIGTNQMTHLCQSRILQTDMGVSSGLSQSVYVQMFICTDKMDLL